MKIYLANSLFSEADRLYNKHVATQLRTKVTGDIEIFLPQEAGINDKSTYADSIMIADLDTRELLQSDVMIAVIDGVEIDAGVASEIGVFYMTGKPIIALYTDIRQFGRNNSDKIKALLDDGVENQFMYRNLYTVGLIKKSGKVVNSIEDLIKEVEELISNK